MLHLSVVFLNLDGQYTCVCLSVCLSPVSLQANCVMLRRHRVSLSFLCGGCVSLTHVMPPTHVHNPWPGVGPATAEFALNTLRLLRIGLSINASSCNSSSGAYRRLDGLILLENICSVRAGPSGRTKCGSWYRPSLLQEEERFPRRSLLAALGRRRRQARLRSHFYSYSFCAHLQPKPRSEVQNKSRHK